MRSRRKHASSAWWPVSFGPHAVAAGRCPAALWSRIVVAATSLDLARHRNWRSGDRRSSAPPAPGSAASDSAHRRSCAPPGCCARSAIAVEDSQLALLHDYPGYPLCPPHV